MSLAGCLFTPALLGLLAGGSAHARALELKAVTFSSELGVQEEVSYAASNIIDRKASSVWVEGEDGSGLGAWVAVDLGSEQTITEIRLWNGNWFTADYWKRHNRAKEIEVDFSDGTKQLFTLKDEMTAEVLRLPKAVRTSSVKIKIKSIYRGSTFNDTCISEVRVFDDTPEPNTLPVKGTASSTYPADDDGTYEVANLWDGMLDSLWCASEKVGDGAGQWVDLDLGGTQTISTLNFRNGNAYSFSLFMKGNRAKVITLGFSDGSSARLEVKNTMSASAYTFPEKTTSKVKITFDEVAKGTEYNVLCLSELSFSG